MNNLSSFVSACKDIGNDKNLVQGGGGNISLKISKKKMIVKASGLELKKVSKKKGFVIIDFEKIKNYIKKKYRQKNMAKHESLYLQTLNESIMQIPSKQPSMETGFHAILGKAVVHTHPVGFNSIACCKGAKKKFETIFGKKIIWIPYRTPGLSLSSAIMKKLKNIKSPLQPKIIILQNHGLIVSGNQIENCVKETKEIEIKCREFLRKHKVKFFSYPANNAGKNRLKLSFTKKLLWNPFKKFLFPDAAVFLDDNIDIDALELNIANKTAASARKIEVLTATLCIMLNINQYGKPNFLQKIKAMELKKMEAEKYRKEAP